MAADSMLMVYIPGGTFQMGSDSGASNEAPVHMVRLSPYWIDSTEVTNAMYKHCVQDGACSPPSSTGSNSRSSYYDNSAYNDYPVIYVSWHDAEAYCAWAGKQLPTEAQWEFAARGTDGRMYPWGDTSPSCSMVNYASCVGDTTAVGSYESGKSPFDVYDMAGNVTVWVADWYGSYSSNDQSGPTGPATGFFGVLRGGSWLFPEFFIRTSNRDWFARDDSDSWLGFRCSLTP